MKLIFDIGCNEGQNFDYYIKKGNVVIGVDGDQELIKKNKKKFKSHISKKKLYLENCVVSKNKSKEKFYIHKYKNVLSQLKKPDKIYDYNTIKIESRICSNIIKKYLKKYNTKKIEFIKIDVENSTGDVLRDLFKNKIFPNYLSVEAQSSEILHLILKSPYRSFKILNGYEIGSKLKKIKIKTKNKFINYNFFKHSAGPYGDDIPGKYFDKLSLLNYFINNGFGWIDINCCIKPSKNFRFIKYKKETHNSRFREKVFQLIEHAILIIKKKFSFKF